MTTDWVTIWAKRALRGLSRYTPATQLEDFAPARDLDEPLIGRYRNPPGTVPEFVLITVRALHWAVGEHKECVAFASIQHATFTPRDKNTADALEITTKDGDVKVIPIAGTDGRNKDVFPVLRFVARAAEALSSP